MSITNRNWYHNPRNNSSQGIVIEEGTGRTVAVAYDPKDTPLLAAAPELLKALAELIDQLEGIGIPDWAGAEGLCLAQARDAIAKAEASQSAQTVDDPLPTESTKANGPRA